MQYLIQKKRKTHKNVDMEFINLFFITYKKSETS